MKLPSRGPAIDVFIGRDGSAWRLYFAPSSWKPETLGAPNGGSIFPVVRPDTAALDRFMRKVDLPFDRRSTADGGVEMRATGPAAVAVAAWLAELVGAGILATTRI